VRKAGENKVTPSGLPTCPAKRLPLQLARADESLHSRMAAVPRRYFRASVFMVPFLVAIFAGDSTTYQMPYQFVHLRRHPRLKLFASQTLIWAGALGIFVAPYLFGGFFSGKWAVALCFLFGWATALCLAFAGGYLEERLKAQLAAQTCPQELIAR
jgi:hypothetical protein